MHTSRNSPTTAEAYEPLIGAHGRDIVEAVITGAALASPRSMIPNFAEILVAVIVRTPASAKSWIDALMNVVSTRAERISSRANTSLAWISGAKSDAGGEEKIPRSGTEVRFSMSPQRVALTGNACQVKNASTYQSGFERICPGLQRASKLGLRQCICHLVEYVIRTPYTACWTTIILYATVHLLASDCPVPVVDYKLFCVIGCAGSRSSLLVVFDLGFGAILRRFAIFFAFAAPLFCTASLAFSAAF